MTTEAVSAFNHVVPRAHLNAAAEAAVVARVPAVALSAVGPDAPAFLHGQLANDVTGLPVGGVNQSLHLNHKGHAIAEGAVLRRAKTELLYVVEGATADWVFESLSGHIIFDDVALARPDLTVITLQGAAAAALLPSPPAEGQLLEFELHGAEVMAYRRARSGYDGFDLLVPAAAADALVEALCVAGATAVGVASLNALRVAAGLPSAVGEGGEGVLPQEAGLLAALSYRKGCYLGQEIMARIEARGNLRRSLRRLTFGAMPPAPPHTDRSLTHEGRTVGVLGTVTVIEQGGGGPPLVEALAVVRNDLPAGVQLSFGGVQATLAEAG